MLDGDLKPDIGNGSAALAAILHLLPKMKLYVGNLSFETTETVLQDAFERYGAVTDVVVMIDRTTNRSRGFGFVTMSSDSEGQAAITGLHGNDLDGRNLTVNEARPREDRPQRSFGSGGGGGGGGGRRY